MNQPINVNETSKEFFETLEKLKNESIDEIEQTIDRLKLKEKDGGPFVVLQAECYTTTN